MIEISRDENFSTQNHTRGGPCTRGECTRVVSLLAGVAACCDLETGSIQTPYKVAELVDLQLVDFHLA